MLSVTTLQQNAHVHTHTPQLFYGPFSRTTRVRRCQKRTSGLYGARETSAYLYHSFFTGRIPFLPPNQQCQSTKGT